ncbi:MAG: hypothetical protein HY513_03955 [Candidatus Aenigmarchaeota archaeon]|nr:hypothetical protein [Candidatus Aenigmarchaeota archaeon]
MKGITPVIAIILLLLITVAMVGFALVWFQRFVSATGSQTEQNLQTQLDQQSKLISIVNINNAGGAKSIVSVKDIGTRNIALTEIAIFVDSSRADVDSVAGCTDAGGTRVTTIATGATIDCTLDTLCSSGSRLKITAPGNFDETICP